MQACLKCNSGQRSKWILAAAGALALTAATAVSAEPFHGAAARVSALNAARQSVQAPAGAGGVQVAIDQATGRLRQPTAEEAQALLASVSELFPAHAEVQVYQFADGTLEADLGGGSMNVSIVSRQSDGSLATHCVSDAGAAVAVLASGVALEAK